jgi:platelet-activating factor acetylhydrolase
MMTIRLRQALLYGSAGVLFLVLAISLTPITSPLPPYTGDYEVGILDIETEVEKRTIHDAVLKETGERAFEVCASPPTLLVPRVEERC